MIVREGAGGYRLVYSINQVPFMVKLIDTKKIHYMHLTLYSHILKNKPTPFSCRFKYVLPFLPPIIKGLIS